MKTRVLVADDSSFMRGAIARLVGSDPRFEVVGQAKDGPEAVKLAAELKPDVLSMDFNMPGLNGVEATKQILAACRATGTKPLPIVMLSAHTVEGAKQTMDALAAGAVDFVSKPGGEVTTQLGEVKDELLQKLAVAAGAKVGAAATPDEPAAISRRAPTSLRAPAMASGLRLVVFAVSTGGPAALELLLARLPKRDNLAGVVVQHMKEGYTLALAERLDALSPCKVREAAEGDRLEAGTVLVARGGRHLEIDRTGGVRLTDGPPMHGVKPAADVTLRSAALAFSTRVVGVVMTGMGRDGATGLAAVKSAGGVTLAQDMATSTVYGMPKAAVDLGVVDQVLPLRELAAAVDRATR